MLDGIQQLVIRGIMNKVHNIIMTKNIYFKLMMRNLIRFPRWVRVGTISA